MDRSKDIEIRIATLADLHPSALQKFNRYQETKRVRYVEKGRYLYKDDHFVEAWDEHKKLQVIEALRHCIQSGGTVAGAFVNNALVGFASVQNGFFGKNNEYLELEYIHVSNEYRHCGIGKKLFELCSRSARDMGARKLYISAHPAVETQGFYDAMGCVPAIEINKEIYAREPLDIQLERALV